MSMYVGMDVHRKRSQIAIVDAAGAQQRNRNLANDLTKLVPILGEVAAAVDKTTGTVKALQHRGLASLARILGPRGPHELAGPPYPSSGPDRLRSQKEQQA